MTSRKEKRKAARLEKKLLKHQALLHHQIIRKSKHTSKKPINTEGLISCSVKDRMVSFDFNEGPLQGIVVNDPIFEQLRTENVIDSESERDYVKPAVVGRVSKRERNKVSKKKTKFEEFLGMELNAGLSMEEDLEMERRLAKKLKLKKGRLDDSGDGLNFLFEGISSFDDFGEDDEMGGFESEIRSSPRKKMKKGKKKGNSEQEFGVDEVFSRDVESGEGDEAEATMDSEVEFVDNDEKKKSKRKKKNRTRSDQEKRSDDDASDLGQAGNGSYESGEVGRAPTESVKDTDCVNGLQSVGKYVAPHLRSRSGGDELQEYLHIRRRIRGLLNRLSESNV